MTALPTMEAGPFRRAAAGERRLKLFLWGDSGAGKTTLALQFPSPAVIDLEGGTEHYGDQFTFNVLKATTADEIATAVDWLLSHPHDYRTLVIDPITVYWDALQAKWSEIFLRRNKGSKGHRLEYYAFQAKDWMTIKAEWKELVRKLIALDMNVIVTARQKVLYAEQGFMRSVGETFDGEKSLPYLFDSILRLYRDDNGRYMAETLKDRSGKLSHGHFEFGYARLERALGKESLVRPAETIRLASEEQIVRLNLLVADAGITPAVLADRLAAYGASRVEDLTAENATLIIKKLEAAAAAKPASALTPVQEDDNAES